MRVEVVGPGGRYLWRWPWRRFYTVTIEHGPRYRTSVCAVARTRTRRGAARVERRIEGAQDAFWPKAIPS